MSTYDSIALPLGSNFKMPIHFQNEHANRFASDVEGINIRYSLSHPRVLHVHIDEMTQVMTIDAHGSGDCAIFLYLENNPNIFDVIRVKVSSIVRPLSPVYLHVGGEVVFKVTNPDDSNSIDSGSSNLSWKSNSPKVLSIGEGSGRAQGLGEGRADVMLSN